MKLLTFLGAPPKGIYDKTTYTWLKQRQTTSWVALACAKFFEIDEAWFVVTEKAEAITYANFLSAKPADLHCSPIRIPTSLTENDLWLIFEEITQVFHPDDDLIIDITHGFRIQPGIGLAIAAYLKEIKKVQIWDIVYGAYEPEKQETQLCSLSSFLDLIQWTFALQNFQRYGHTEFLADSLLDAEFKVKRRIALELTDVQRPTYLHGLADAAQRMGQALHLLRPEEAGRAGEKMLHSLRQGEKEIATHAKPLHALADSIREEIQPILAQSHATFDARYMRSLLETIEWYIEKGKSVQAIILARAWIVTHITLHLECNPRKYIGHREKAEKLLRDIWRGHLHSLPPFLPKEMLDKWNVLRELRNEIAHVFETHPSEKLHKKIAQACLDLVVIGLDYYKN